MRCTVGAAPFAPFAPGVLICRSLQARLPPKARCSSTTTRSRTEPSGRLLPSGSGSGSAVHTPACGRAPARRVCASSVRNPGEATANSGRRFSPQYDTVNWLPVTPPSAFRPITTTATHSDRGGASSSR